MQKRDDSGAEKVIQKLRIIFCMSKLNLSTVRLIIQNKYQAIRLDV